ncbi:hypothetical protein D3C73_1626880 [compost metagenome]
MGKVAGSKPLRAAVSRYASTEPLKLIAGPPSVVNIIGIPAYPALIALAGGPPTARQMGI